MRLSKCLLQGYAEVGSLVSQTAAADVRRRGTVFGPTFVPDDTPV